MTWQDIVLSIGTVVFIVALLPSIFSSHKPALSTSIMTGAVIYSFSFVFFTLELWFTAIFTLFSGLCWTILAIQKYTALNKKPKK